MGSWTYREYKMRLAWLDAREWEYTSKQDYLLMRIAQRVHQGWVKPSAVGKITIDDQKLEFELALPKEKKTPLSVAEQSKISQARWMAGVGMKPNG